MIYWISQILQIFPLDKIILTKIDSFAISNSLQFYFEFVILAKAEAQDFSLQKYGVGFSIFESISFSLKHRRFDFKRHKSFPS